MIKIKLWVVSLGCNKTLVDTQNLLWTLNKKINLVSEVDADFILLNTCSFLKSARDEVHENLELFKDKKVILVWCYTKFAEEDIFDKYPQICAVIPTNKYWEIENILESIIKWKKIFFNFEIEEQYLEMPETKYLTLPHVAYVKISEWCDNTCSYCTIPKIRWKFRSRLPENIIAEIKQLSNRWCKEIILTSQDTWCYGKDLKQDINFTGLLNSLIKIPWNFKIRFLYMYPERITDELLDLVANNNKIMPYFDIPFQHASKKVLIWMKRPFGDKLHWWLVERIKKRLPDAVIRTTFIVWFPWETDEDFEYLCDFIKKYKFERTWIFRYSNEKWAESFNLPDQIPENIKQKRFDKLYKLSAKISLKNNEKLTKNQVELEAIIDWFDQQNNAIICRSYRETPEEDPVIYVLLDYKSKLDIWDTIKIRIIWCNEYDLIWEIIS